MDYKEEYQKALERAKKGLPIDEVFPELKESEDERIRKIIIKYFKGSIGLGVAIDGVSVKDIVTYLEKQKERERIVPEREATDFEIEVHEVIAQARRDKRLADKDVLEQFEKEASCALMWKAEKQKEQKPVEWSEEDVEVLETTIATIEKNIKKGSQITTRATPSGIINREDLIKKLKSLKNRGNSPKSNTNFPIEWNEEDEKTIDEAVEYIEKYAEYVQGGYSKQYVLDLARRVDSLRPQPHWKPSEEQMKALNKVIHEVSMSLKLKDKLIHLEDELKKL